MPTTFGVKKQVPRAVRARITHLPYNRRAPNCLSTPRDCVLQAQHSKHNHPRPGLPEESAQQPLCSNHRAQPRRSKNSDQQPRSSYHSAQQPRSSHRSARQPLISKHHHNPHTDWQAHTSVPQSPDPTTLLIGDSLIRDVRRKMLKTCCFPGATLCDITDKIPQILQNHPAVDKIILRVDSNNISKQV